MVQIRYDVKLRLQAIPRVAANLQRGCRPAMQEIAADMLRSAQQCFRTMTDPWGRRWRPHSPTTLALYRRGGLIPRRGPSRSRRTGRFAAFGSRGSVAGRVLAPIRSRGLLWVTGRLFNSLRTGATATEATLRVDGDAKLRAIARVQNFGNPRNRLPNRPGGNPAPIPARAFMPTKMAGGRMQHAASPDFRRRARDAIKRNVFAGVRR